MRIIVPLVAGLLTTACATGTARAPVTTLPGSFEASGGIAPTIQLDRWWILYGDAQLTALVEEALARGFSAREALARLDEARLVRRTALNRFDVQGDVQANASRQRTYDLGPGDGTGVPATGGGGTGPATGGGFAGGAGGFVFPGRSDSYALSLPVSWELDLFGRRSAARRSADADLEASIFAYQGARATLAADVADQLFQARGLAVQIADAAETVRIREELRRIVDIRARRGLAPRADADRIETDLATARAQLAGLEAELFAARRTLLALLGRAGDRVDTVPATPTLAVPPPVPPGLPADLLVRRPDIREARARLESTLGQLRTAELAQFPSLTLTPGIGLNAQRGVFESTTGFWSIGAGLVAPLLNRGRVRNEVRIADVRTEQAVLAFERTVQTAFSETDQAIRRLEADRRRAAVLAQGEGRARAAYEAVLIQYRRGLIDLQRLLDSEATWRAARAQTVTASLDALSRSVQLFKALGGGWSSPTAPSATYPRTDPN
ncbi:TolC family protein [Sphingomonas sp.]|jgi:NodT family efflux transporter outer membrane factor (OMF) lipoprotein|uniref:TolC family protein n=1 Tax=Sphingomonas sp. TaxID=28214 RepID=UPI002D7EAA86|nr:TolC family protein [Sphingomonas sp.]HEU0043124.1 TolC family protein [Sphingomonas sp.]